MNKNFFRNSTRAIVYKLTLPLLCLLVSFTEPQLAYSDARLNETMATKHNSYSSYSSHNYHPYEPSGSNADNYHYRFSYDKDFSSIASADLILSGAEAYRLIDDNVFNNPDNFILCFAGYLSRMLVTAMLSTTQHEFGGHGARLREFGVDVKSYSVHLDASGSTSFNSIQFDKLHPHKKIAAIIGGVESSYIISRKLAERFLLSGKMNPVNSMLYIWSATDQVDYVFSMKKHQRYDDQGHDIADYIKHLNKFYGEAYVNRDKLRNVTLFDLLDPMLYFSASSFVSNEVVDVPMIEFGGWGYLPAFRSILAPYGPEVSLVNHFKHGDSYYRVAFANGKNRAGDSYNIHFTGCNLYQAEINSDVIKSISFGGELDVWRQPKLFSYYNIGKSHMQNGLLTEINMHLNIFDKFGIDFALGYKSRGFAIGRPLNSTGMLRLGCAFDL